MLLWDQVAHAFGLERRLGTREMRYHIRRGRVELLKGGLEGTKMIYNIRWWAACNRDPMVVGERLEVETPTGELPPPDHH